MADDREDVNDRERVDEPLDDEMGDRKRTTRKEQRADSNRDLKAGEPTDTLEDRNLSGSSTWATLPDQNQGEDGNSDNSENGPERNR